MSEVSHHFLLQPWPQEAELEAEQDWGTLQNKREVKLASIHNLANTQSLYTIIGHFSHNFLKCKKCGSNWCLDWLTNLRNVPFSTTFELLFVIFHSKATKNKPLSYITTAVRSADGLDPHKPPQINTTAMFRKWFSSFLTVKTHHRVSNPKPNRLTLTGS